MERGEDYYDKLGVTKIINAAGTYTALTASIMPPSVQAAVARAAEHPVRLGELQKAAGEYLARKLKCEAALVTAGAASALTLGTAGCVTVANKCGIRDIPTEVSAPQERGHHPERPPLRLRPGLVVRGIRIVEVETMQQYEAAFNDRTVMAHFFNAAEQGDRSAAKTGSAWRTPTECRASTMRRRTSPRSRTSGTTRRWASTS